MIKQPIKNDKELDEVKGYFIDDNYFWKIPRKKLDKAGIMKEIRKQHILTHEQTKELKAYIDGLEESLVIMFKSGNHTHD